MFKKEMTSLCQVCIFLLVQIIPRTKSDEVPCSSEAAVPRLGADPCVLQGCLRQAC